MDQLFSAKGRFIEGDMDLGLNVRTFAAVVSALAEAETVKALILEAMEAAVALRAGASTAVKAASPASTLAVEITKNIFEDIIHILSALEMIFLIRTIRTRIRTAETTLERIALCTSIAASLPCSFIEGGMTKLII